MFIHAYILFRCICMYNASRVVYKYLLATDVGFRWIHDKVDSMNFPGSGKRQAR